jgi:hypothetical protein
MLKISKFKIFHMNHVRHPILDEMLQTPRITFDKITKYIYNLLLSRFNNRLSQIL